MIALVSDVSSPFFDETLALKVKQKTKIAIFFIHFLVFQSYFLKTNTTNSNNYLHKSLEGCHLCDGSHKILCRYISIFTT